MRLRKARRLTVGEERAVACARVAGAYADLLSAALAHLELHYAARISGLMLCRRGDQRAAVATLQREREAARDELRSRLLREKRSAIDGIAKQTRRRYQVAAVPVVAVVPREMPRRPAIRRLARGAASWRHSSP